MYESNRNSAHIENFIFILKFSPRSLTIVIQLISLELQNIIHQIYFSYILLIINFISDF